MPYFWTSDNYVKSKRRMKKEELRRCCEPVRAEQSTRLLQYTRNARCILLVTRKASNNIPKCSSMVRFVVDVVVEEGGSLALRKASCESHCEDG